MGKTIKNDKKSKVKVDPTVLNVFAQIKSIALEHDVLQDVKIYSDNTPKSSREQSVVFFCPKESLEEVLGLWRKTAETNNPVYFPIEIDNNCHNQMASSLWKSFNPDDWTLFCKRIVWMFAQSMPESVIVNILDSCNVEPEDFYDCSYCHACRHFYPHRKGLSMESALEKAFPFQDHKQLYDVMKRQSSWAWKDWLMVVPFAFESFCSTLTVVRLSIIPNTQTREDTTSTVELDLNEIFQDLSKT